MAFYPLKVKDGDGNVHTVGDPRIVNGGDQSPLVSISDGPGGWGRIVVDGSKITVGKAVSPVNTGVLTRLAGWRVKFTVPSGVFTARVLSVTEAPSVVLEGGAIDGESIWNHTLSLSDISVVSGTYPADGTVYVSGVWLEDAGDYDLVKNKGTALTDVTVRGSRLNFAPLTETLFQITGPTETVVEPVAPATNWSDVFWFTKYDSQVFIYATWNGPDTAIRQNWNFPSGTDGPEWSVTLPDATVVTWNQSRDWYAVSNQIKTLADLTANPNDLGFSFPPSGPTLTLTTGTQYVIMTPIGLAADGWVTNNTALEANAPASDTGTTLTALSIGQPDNYVYQTPTSVENPLTTIQESDYHAEITTDWGAKYFGVGIITPAEKESGRSPRVLATGDLSESGSYLVSPNSLTSSLLASVLSDSSYPVDVVVGPPAPNTDILFPRDPLHSTTFQFSPGSGSVTVGGSALAVAGKSQLNVSSVTSGTDYLAVDVNNATSTYIGQGGFSAGLDFRLWQYTFQLIEGAAADDFWDNFERRGYANYSWTLLTERRAVISDLQRLYNMSGTWSYAYVNGNPVPMAQFDTQTRTISLLVDTDLSQTAVNYKSQVLWTIYLRGRSSGWFPDGPRRQTVFEPGATSVPGLSTDGFVLDTPGGPEGAGYSLTSTRRSFKWAPSAGHVIQAVNGTTGATSLSLPRLGYDYFGQDMDAYGWYPGFSLRVLLSCTASSASLTNTKLWMKLKNAAGGDVPQQWSTHRVTLSTGALNTSYNNMNVTPDIRLSELGTFDATSGTLVADIRLTYGPSGGIQGRAVTTAPKGGTAYEYTTRFRTDSDVYLQLNSATFDGLEFFVASAYGGTRMSATWRARVIQEIGGN